MTAPASSPSRSWSLGAVALGLIFAGWLWFAVCFTARAAAWWNSLWLFAALYTVAILLAFRSLKSWLSILALVLAMASLAFVSLFLFR